MIDQSAKIGKNTVIEQPELSNIYGCVIGSNCHIAAFVEINKGVVIGNNVKIGAFTFIPNGAVIEDNVFIGPHTVFTNDKYPRATNQKGTLKTEKDWKLQKTLIKKGASIGANSTIICGITIGKHALVGAGSVVTKNVPENATVKGNPAV